jgi:hypothetical protein
MYTNNFEALRDKLLTIGGEAALAPREVDAATLLARGRLFPVEGRRRVRGRRHQAYQDVALQYLLRRHFGRGSSCSIGVGYALRGGCWCPHAWLLRGGRVLETCGRPDAYFGVVLDDEEAAAFLVRAVERITSLRPSPPATTPCSRALTVSRQRPRPVPAGPSCFAMRASR